MNNWICQDRRIFHHEYDWYCDEDGTFPLLKGDLPGPGFNGMFVAGPYRTRLLAHSSYIKATGKNPICVSHYSDWRKDYD